MTQQWYTALACCVSVRSSRRLGERYFVRVEILADLPPRGTRHPVGVMLHRAPFAAQAKEVRVQRYSESISHFAHRAWIDGAFIVPAPTFFDEITLEAGES